jgi:hypothetical protein
MRRLPHVPTVPSREESMTTAKNQREERTMFLHTDPQAQLDLYHQRAGELARQAADYRLARSAAGGHHRRSGRWPRTPKADRSARVSVGP